MMKFDFSWEQLIGWVTSMFGGGVVAAFLTNSYSKNKSIEQEERSYNLAVELVAYLEKSLAANIEAARQAPDIPRLEFVKLDLSALASVGEWSKKPIYDRGNLAQAIWFESLMKLIYRSRDRLIRICDKERNTPIVDLQRDFIEIERVFIETKKKKPNK